MSTSHYAHGQVANVHCTPKLAHLPSSVHSYRIEVVESVDGRKPLVVFRGEEEKVSDSSPHEAIRLVLLPHSSQRFNFIVTSGSDMIGQVSLTLNELLSDSIKQGVRLQKQNEDGVDQIANELYSSASPKHQAPTLALNVVGGIGTVLSSNTTGGSRSIQGRDVSNSQAISAGKNGVKSTAAELVSAPHHADLRFKDWPTFKANEKVSGPSFELQVSASNLFALDSLFKVAPLVSIHSAKDNQLLAHTEVMSNANPRFSHSLVVSAAQAPFLLRVYDVSDEELDDENLLGESAPIPLGVLQSLTSPLDLPLTNKNPSIEKRLRKKDALVRVAIKAPPASVTSPKKATVSPTQNASSGTKSTNSTPMLVGNDTRTNVTPAKLYEQSTLAGIKLDKLVFIDSAGMEHTSQPLKPSKSTTYSLTISAANLPKLDPLKSQTTALCAIWEKNQSGKSPWTLLGHTEFVQGAFPQFQTPITVPIRISSVYKVELFDLDGERVTVDEKIGEALLQGDQLLSLGAESELDVSLTYVANPAMEKLLAKKNATVLIARSGASPAIIARRNSTRAKQMAARASRTSTAQPSASSTAGLTLPTPAASPKSSPTAAAAVKSSPKNESAPTAAAAKTIAPTKSNESVSTTSAAPSVVTSTPAVAEPVVVAIPSPRSAFRTGLTAGAPSVTVDTSAPVTSTSTASSSSSEGPRSPQQIAEDQAATSEASAVASEVEANRRVAELEEKILALQNKKNKKDKAQKESLEKELKEARAAQAKAVAVASEARANLAQKRAARIAEEDRLAAEKRAQDQANPNMTKWGERKRTKSTMTGSIAGGNIDDIAAARRAQAGSVPTARVPSSLLLLRLSVRNIQKCGAWKPCVAVYDAVKNYSETAEKTEVGTYLDQTEKLEQISEEGNASFSKPILLENYSQENQRLRFNLYNIAADRASDSDLIASGNVSMSALDRLSLNQQELFIPLYNASNKTLNDRLKRQKSVILVQLTQRSSHVTGGSVILPNPSVPTNTEGGVDPDGQKPYVVDVGATSPIPEESPSASSSTNTEADAQARTAEQAAVEATIKQLAEEVVTTAIKQASEQVAQIQAAAAAAAAEAARVAAAEKAAADEQAMKAAQAAAAEAEAAKQAAKEAAEKEAAEKAFEAAAKEEAETKAALAQAEKEAADKKAAEAEAEAAAAVAKEAAEKEAATKAELEAAEKKAAEEAAAAAAAAEAEATKKKQQQEAEEQGREIAEASAAPVEVESKDAAVEPTPSNSVPATPASETGSVEAEEWTAANVVFPTPVATATAAATSSSSNEPVPAGMKLCAACGKIKSKKNDFSAAQGKKSSGALQPFFD